MEIQFTAKTHEYKSLKNPKKKWISTTSLVSLFKSKFDADAQSVKSSKNKRSKWYGMAPEEIREVWAKVDWVGGSETNETDKITATTKVDFYIRYESYKDTIQPNWRIRYEVNDGEVSASYIYFYIENIAHIDGRHKVTRLTAVQKDND